MIRIKPIKASALLPFVQQRRALWGVKVLSLFASLRGYTYGQLESYRLK